jgi:catechol-2,3-dioxygenase
MVTRIGHMALRVADLDAAVAFHRDILQLTETERVGRTAYLTCNDRHHELILIEDQTPGYDHVGLEVAGPAALEQATQRARQAGAQLLGGMTEDEPGIAQAQRFVGPGGHIFKLFYGMESGDYPLLPDAPEKFEHISLKVLRMAPMERFLRDALGFRFSDRMGPFASWWHCDPDHHGMALVRSPRSELAHHAWTFQDLNALGRLADRLIEHGERPVWGPSRHGPGANHFLYYREPSGALVECCSDMAKMDEGYQPRHWPVSQRTLNPWGSGPPLSFLLAGATIHPAAGGRTPDQPS